jgi:hypothetical protein
VGGWVGVRDNRQICFCMWFRTFTISQHQPGSKRSRCVCVCVYLLNQPRHRRRRCGEAGRQAGSRRYRQAGRKAGVNQPGTVCAGVCVCVFNQPNQPSRGLQSAGIAALPLIAENERDLNDYHIHPHALISLPI